MFKYSTDDKNRIELAVLFGTDFQPYSIMIIDDRTNETFIPICFIALFFIFWRISLVAVARALLN